MFKHFFSPIRPLASSWLAAPLVAALLMGTAPAHAQVAPTPAPPLKATPTNATYYVDGKLSSEAELAKIDPNTISYMQIIKGANAQKLFGSTTADGVAVITTTAKANSPEVLAFNKRVGAVVPLTPATPAQNAAIAAIKAYMTQTYPTAKLEMMGPAKDKPGRYQAIFTDHDQRLQLFFDGQGQPVQQ
ncbi:MAG: hypothetical protein ACRYG7_33575 [Janthinobacterium lividum]